jgi:hypothetical protein
MHGPDGDDDARTERVIHFDDDIWPRVRQDRWKYRIRDQRVTLIELHCTRSGIAGRTPLEEYNATINWSLSPDNRNERSMDDWASMESFIVGGGKVCRVLADEVWPHYSLGHADPAAYSIEIGQNLPSTPFDPRDIDHAAQICAELVQRHPIPVRVLPWLSADNHEGGGFVRHDRSANGQYWGKSDPGPLFDDRAFEEKVRGYLQEEDDMTTYRLFQTWGPAKTWIIAYVSDVPIYRRWLVTQEGVNKLRATLGEPETISEGQLATIPKL